MKAGHLSLMFGILYGIWADVTDKTYWKIFAWGLAVLWHGIAIYYLVFK